MSKRVRKPAPSRRARKTIETHRNSARRTKRSAARANKHRETQSQMEGAKKTARETFEIAERERPAGKSAKKALRAPHATFCNRCRTRSTPNTQNSLSITSAVQTLQFSIRPPRTLRKCAETPLALAPCRKTKDIETAPWLLHSVEKMHTRPHYLNLHANKLGREQLRGTSKERTCLDS